MIAASSFLLLLSLVLLAMWTCSRPIPGTSLFSECKDDTYNFYCGFYIFTETGKALLCGIEKEEGGPPKFHGIQVPLDVCSGFIVFIRMAKLRNLWWLRIGAPPNLEEAANLQTLFL